MSNKDNKLLESLKSVVGTTVAAAFLTEDAIKSLLQDLPLPKEMVGGLVKNAKGVKEDFISAVQEEVREKINKIDPKRLIEEVVNNYDFEVNATISLKKKDGSSE